MAKKKIYAVRKGHKTGLFETWAECQKRCLDTPEQSSEASQTEKKRWHSCKCQLLQMYLRIKKKKQQGIVEVPENMVIAYVDGSFEKSIGRYAFGCVILTPGRRRI